MPESPAENTNKIPILKRPVDVKLLSILIFILALIGFSGWSFYNYQQAKKEILRLSTLEGQQDLQQREVDKLLDAVAGHLVLPENEQPTVATISDIKALTESQPFFQGANNGDKVIVYVNAGRAIIYSPDRDVIINVGAVVVDNDEVAMEDIEDEAVLSDETSNEDSELQE